MEAAIYATAGLLFVGLISGLAFLAVHYPKTFYSVGLVISFVAGIPIFVITGFIYGELYASHVLRAFIPPEKIEQAKATLLFFGPSGWALSGMITIFTLCLLGLLLVSKGIEREKKHIKAARKRRE